MGVRVLKFNVCGISCCLSDTLQPFKSLCQDRGKREDFAHPAACSRPVALLATRGGTTMSQPCGRRQKPYLNCSTGIIAKAALLWPNGLHQTPPFQAEEWMHRLSYSPKCPWFPHSPAPEKQSRWPFSPWPSSHSKADNSSGPNISLCFIPLLFCFLLWKPSHFWDWLNRLMGFWGFPHDEDVHWGLFTKWTEKSCSDTQYLGPLHRKPHSLLPSHQGQPHSWSFTCLFIYLKGNYHLVL